MYRKPRPSEGASILNLDSLMDILSCLVGVMLFLVIYTVLELGSASYEVSVPTPRDRPVDSRRVLVITNDGTVRGLDSTQPVSDLVAGLRTVAGVDLDQILRDANQSPPTDQHFQYLLDIDRDAAVADPNVREFDVEVREIPGEVGDSIHQLDAGSFDELLSTLDPRFAWIEFAVDVESLEVFRRARDIAEGRGFATRWGPLDIEFPVRFDLGSGSDGPSPRGILSKPQR
ncbi:MAG: hypothetical protein L7S64_07335 [Longimicrobiales bacterium]|nr:hypothetical protein [Longimicrobiales bacterium]